MPLDKTNVQGIGNLLFDLAENLLNDQHGVKAESLAMLKDVQAELRSDLTSHRKKKWNDMMKQVDSGQGRYFLPERV